MDGPYNAAGSNYNNPYASNPGPGVPQAAEGLANPYSTIFTDPKAQLGFQVGRNALNYGQEYIGKNITEYVSFSALKYYFQVSNSYVYRKLVLLLFPWRHKPWTRMMQRSDGTSLDGFATARDDINAPDMYIPLMAFTTYVLAASVTAGLQGTFHPRILGYYSSQAIALMAVELLILKLGTYLLSAGSNLLDFAAYSGYKYVAITMTIFVSSCTSTLVPKWLVFFYAGLSNSFFMLRSMRYILLPDTVTSPTQTINSRQRQRRVQFLFVYTFVYQLIIMWFLLPSKRSNIGVPFVPKSQNT